MKTAIAAAVMAMALAGTAHADDSPIAPENVLERVDANGNGRITCKEARAAGLATPVMRDHPAYPYMNDRDNDGQVCE